MAYITLALVERYAGPGIITNIIKLPSVYGQEERVEYSPLNQKDILAC